MSIDVPPHPDYDGLWGQRWQLLASEIAIAVAIAVLVASQQTHWRWSLLVWGIAIGLLGLAIIMTVVAAARRRGVGTAQRSSSLTHRLIVYAGLWISFGVEVGVVAAAFDLVWVDVAAAVLLVVSFGAGTAVALLVMRRRRQQHA